MYNIYIIICIYNIYTKYVYVYNIYIVFSNNNDSNTY